MTDEQIKQNAEEYASKLVERDYHEDMWLDLYDAHVAGAHSRDEEVRQLHDIINDYSETIDKLRNPWISAKERLPEHSVDVLVVSNYGDLDEFHVAMLNPYGDFWQTSDCMIIEEGVHSWMPLPETPKGGEK